MIRTAIACLALAIGAHAAASWLTHDFQVWTAEGARRLEVALAPVPAPPVQVEGPGLAPGLRLSDVLADGHSVTIVDFFYTRCETVCLSLGTTFQQLQAALQQDAPPSPVRLVSISFDPRDTTQDLRAYAARLHAGPSWRFLRAADARQTAQLLEAFRVTVVPSGRDFEHNAALLVVDPRGRLVRAFDIAEQQLALDYARHLARQESAP
jgi:protein SCO1/2